MRKKTPKRGYKYEPMVFVGGPEDGMICLRARTALYECRWKVGQIEVEGQVLHFLYPREGWTAYDAVQYLLAKHLKRGGMATLRDMAQEPGALKSAEKLYATWDALIARG